MRKMICITLEETQIKAIDTCRGYVPRSRFIDQAIEEHLKTLKKQMVQVQELTNASMLEGAKCILKRPGLSVNDRKLIKAYIDKRGKK